MNNWIFQLGLQRVVWTRGEVSGAISMRVSETSEENIWSERRRDLRKNP